jgi:hypothetical protein
MCGLDYSLMREKREQAEKPIDYCRGFDCCEPDFGLGSQLLNPLSLLLLRSKNEMRATYSSHKIF